MFLWLFATFWIAACAAIGGWYVGYMGGLDEAYRVMSGWADHAREQASTYRSEYFRLWEQMHERDGGRLK